MRNYPQSVAKGQTKRMFTTERQEEILEFINKKRSVTVDELAQEFFSFPARR